MSGDNDYRTSGGNHGTWDLRSRQCNASMPCVAKMTIRLPPTGTLVSGNGYLVDLDLEHITRLREHGVPSVRHAAASLTRDLSGQFAPAIQAGTSGGWQH